MNQDKSDPLALKSILAKYQVKKDGKYISQEFQDFGYRLAVDLDDIPHKALYIRLAKSTPRAMLEAARRFVVDAPTVRNKGKLFMWKLSELRKETKK